MRNLLFATVTATAMAAVTSFGAAALPANGAAAIGAMGNQIDSVIVVKKAKKKPADTSKTPACPADTEPSTRTTGCRPANSQRNG